jgi:basic amino acid/polyamine antiporter, APA family
LTGALCYGELASRMPETGGAYVFLRSAWGEPVAFLYGWKCLLVMDPGLTAALAKGLAGYAAYLAPLGTGGQKIVAIAVILLLAALAARGTRLAAGVLVLVTVLKLAVLGVIVVLGYAAGGAGPGALDGFFARTPDAPPLVPALAAGFVVAFFSFGGWWEAARMAGEVRDPARTLPRAFVLGIAVVTGLYMLTSAVFMRLVPPAESHSSEAFAAAVGERLFGEAGGAILAAAVIVSVVGSLAAVILLTPRTYVALARDGLLPARIGRLHPRLGTPVTAIALQAALAVILVSLGSFSDIVAYFVFVTVAFIALSVASLYRLPAPPEGTFRTPWRRLTPAVFVGLCVLLLALMLVGRPVQSLIGAIVVLLGYPVYVFLQTSGRLRQEKP